MEKRRNFTPEQKAKIVIEVLREEKSLSEIAAEYEIHPICRYICSRNRYQSDISWGSLSKRCLRCLSRRCYLAGILHIVLRMV